MHLSTIFAAVFSVIMIWNLMDWKPGDGEKVVYLPKSKAFRIALTLWGIAAGLSAIAMIIELIPSWLFLLITFSWISTAQIMSVLIREKLRKQKS